MKKFIKNAAAVGFLVLFLPYTATLLMNGKQGIHREEELPQLEYQVLSCLMQEDYSWMEDKTLDLMAVLYRTECVREEPQRDEEFFPEIYDKNYDRMYDAVMRTRGQVITTGGEYKELPYHAVSAGRTREGVLLGEEYDYVAAVDCPYDKEAEDYFRTYVISSQDLEELLGEEFAPGDAEFERDAADYVSHVVTSGREWQGEEFRSLLHLPSSCFWMEEEEGADRVRITVKGSGHGFGLSLYTADRMIRDGAEMTEIIQKFYKDTACITIP